MTEPITHPKLGTSTLKYRAWPNVRTTDIHHWWTLDVGPLFVDSEAQGILKMLRSSGLRPPWVKVGVDYEFGKLVVSLPINQAEKLR
jgi:hypothetical protein|tara:strand:+ start:3461 stop:3721 length:261 start_codon:yes stop_codon:yes gene_type:complete